MPSKPNRRFSAQTINTGDRWRLNRFIQLFPVLLAILLTILLTPSCALINNVLGYGLAKIHFGCLPDGSLIDTPHGVVQIQNLKAGDTVVGFDGKPVRINQIHQYREDPATSRYITIHFSNGSVVSASPRHRINGIPASMFKVGDTCGSCSVAGIETLAGVSRSFDLLTEDAGYRIAGIPVNSMIEEMAAYGKDAAPVISKR